MRRIITTTFLSLDGVIQAPGGPEEDTSGGFAYGGWTVSFQDESGGEVMTSFMNQEFDLLLGRKTYDIFAGYWPDAKTDLLIADKFNKATKYVVSHSPIELPWENSILITGNVPEELKKLKKEDGPDLWVHGSGELIQTLLKEELIDVMHLWVCPVTIGQGKRLFASGTKPKSFQLIEHTVTETGVIIATYLPSGGLRTGTVGE